LLEEIRTRSYCHEVDKGVDDCAGCLDPFCCAGRDNIHNADEQEEGCECKHPLNENFASTIAIDDDPGEKITSQATGRDADAKIERFGCVKTGELEEVRRVS